MRHAVSPSFTSIVLLAAGLAATPAALAQGDQQTEDWEEQDRQYMQRYLAGGEEEDAPSDAGSAEADPAARFLERAEALIRQHRRFGSASSERYRVETDDPRLDATEVVRLLDAFDHFFESFWRDRTPLRDAGTPGRVFLFYSYHDYNELLDADFSRRFRRPKGHYVAEADVAAVHTDSDLPGGLGDSLIHEAAHRLVERRLLPPGAEAPLWVAEGLASYFGFTRLDRDGAFRAGEVGGKAAEPIRGEPGGRSREATSKLDALKRALRSEDDRAEGGWLRQLLALDDPARFYGGRADVNYAASWILVHWLLHGDGGAHAAAFVRYLSGLGDGESADLLAELGLGAGEVQAAAEAHARKLKVR